MTATHIENVRDVAGRRRAGGAEVQITGLEETLRALKAFEPDVFKRTTKTIRVSLTKVKTVADFHLRMAGHRSGANYSVRMRNSGRRTGGRVLAVSKDASIFEFAGSKGRSKTGGPITPQGAAMVRWLERDFGKPGRFLWDSWDLQKVALDKELRATVADSEHELQQRLDAAGERY